jgi:hypothetical protein
MTENATWDEYAKPVAADKCKSQEVQRCRRGTVIRSRRTNNRLQRGNREKEGEADPRKARIPELRVILAVDGTVISIPRPAPWAEGEDRKSEHL